MLLVVGSGCGSLKKKFVRPSRPKPAPAAHTYYDEKAYERLPNRIQYEKAFSLWRVWHSESLNALTQNQKRARMGLREAVTQLIAMRQLLEGAKAEELSPHLERLQKVRSDFERGRLGEAALDRARILLEKELQQIETSFSLKNVETFLLPDSS